MNSTMTIGKRFIITSGTLLLLTLVLATVATFGLNSVGTHVHALATDSIPGITYAEAMRGDLALLRGDILKHIASTEATGKATMVSNIAEDQALLDKDMQSYEDAITDEADRQNFARLKEEFASFRQEWEKVRPVSESLRNAEAFEMYNARAFSLFASMRAHLKDLLEYNQKVNDQYIAAATISVQTFRSLAIGTGIVSMVLGIALSWYMIMSLNRELTLTIAELTDGSVQIVSAANQVASSSQALAQGASEQAATIEETSSASTEINSMARRNTENSHTAAETVTRAGEGIARANNSLTEMVDAMNDINASSNKISKIIKVIDEIAFQTNILALNAAVEAARAGEAGMGFAVVADEVRSLAQRCAQAAKDTADLIEESIQKSEGGKVKVDHVSEAMQVLTADAAQIKMLVEQINTGSIEQSHGIDQIGSAITQMEHVTQNSAASAEQGAAAAQQLNAQASSLNTVVKRLSSLVSSGPSLTQASAQKLSGLKHVWKTSSLPAQSH